MEQEDVRPFKFLANILELKVRIRNLTDEATYLDEWGWMPQNEEDVDPDAPPFRDAELMREAYEAAERLNAMPSRIDPLDTAAGQIATAMPHQSPGCVDAYSVHIKDERGATYVLLMPRRGESKVWPR